MRLHRFYIKDIYLPSDLLKLTDPEVAHQLYTVFKAKKGDRILVFNNKQVECEVIITDINKKVVSLEQTKVLAEGDKLLQPREMMLAFALLKGEHTEMVLEKCTELGVTAFQPLITDRTVKIGFRKDRLEKIIKEATEQCGFVKLPKLLEPITLKDLLKGGGTNFFIMDMGGEKLTPVSPCEKGEVVIVVGPEGGWSDDERKLFENLNLKTFSLTNQTLRAETACIATTSRFL